MDSTTTDLLPGTLDLLILEAVSLTRLHEYGVLLRIRQISKNPSGGGALPRAVSAGTPGIDHRGVGV